MTLVVARIHDKQISLAADTLLSEHSMRLPISQGTIKICLLPGNLCAGFSNSPELAESVFRDYSDQYPNGAGFSETIDFFERASAKTHNDFLIAFGNNPKIVKIADGKRISSIAKTLWIGDKDGYERFREYETRSKKGPEQGRAVSAVIFADEPEGSPASDLYSTMRQVIADRKTFSVGGFIAVASSRGPGFRFSVYSDVLYDWPEDQAEDYELKLEDKIRLLSSNENDQFSVTQISPLYMNGNYLAFYLLRGKKLFIFYGTNNGLANKCHVESGVEPGDIYEKMSSLLGFDLKWLVFVMSGSNTKLEDYVGYQSNTASLPADGGVSLGLFCHANTCPANPGESGIMYAVQKQVGRSLLDDVAPHEHRSANFDALEQ